MSVIRLAAKLTVRWRSALGEASHTTGSGKPAPNGGGDLSKVGSSGTGGVGTLLGLEAIGGELVAVEVAAIPGIGRRVPRARPDRPLVRPALRQCGLVETRHSGAARRGKADRAA